MKKTDIGVVTFYVYIFLVFTDSGPYFGNFIFIIYAVYLLAHILIQFNLFLVMFTEVFVVFFYFLSTSFVRHTWPSMNIHVGIPRRGIAKVVARSRSVVVIEFRPDKQAPINSPEAAFQYRRFDFHVFYTDRVTITVTVSARRFPFLSDPYLGLYSYCFCVVAATPRWTVRVRSYRTFVAAAALACTLLLSYAKRLVPSFRDCERHTNSNRPRGRKTKLPQYVGNASRPDVA